MKLTIDDLLLIIPYRSHALRENAFLRALCAIEERRGASVGVGSDAEYRNQNIIHTLTVSFYLFSLR